MPVLLKRITVFIQTGGKQWKNKKAKQVKKNRL